MGNYPHVQCHPYMESPSEPGFKSIVSESLEEYCTADEFYDELLVCMQSPVTPAESYMVKELSCVHNGPEDFTVKVRYDGQKMKTFGLSRSGTDKTKLYQRIVGNRKEHTFVCTNMNEDDTLQSMATCKLLKDPVRMEYNMIVDGERRCGKYLAGVIEHAYITPVLTRLSNRKVKVHPDHRSTLQGGGMSAISEPLDEFLTYDMAFDNIIDIIKYPSELSPSGYEQQTQLTEFENGFELKIFEHEMLKEINCAKEDMPHRDMNVLAQYSKARGEIHVVCSIGQELLSTNFTYFHRDPLRVEAWQVVDGKRLGGVQEALTLQFYVDLAVRKSEGKTGWYF